MPRVTVAQLRQHIEDLEAGVAVRFDELAARLSRVETDLAIIKEHLVTRMRRSENHPDGGLGHRETAGDGRRKDPQGNPKAIDERPGARDSGPAGAWNEFTFSGRHRTTGARSHRRRDEADATIGEQP